MNKLIYLAFALAIGIGLLIPTGKPTATSATAAKAEQGELFEAPAYQETVLERQNGHFFVNAEINGASINFLVDTGASMVALTEEDARAVGLEFSPEEFRPIARTASGIAKGKSVVLPNVTIEGKEVTEVDAAIVEGAGISLLGQSYLARISGVEMTGERMVLR